MPNIFNWNSIEIHKKNFSPMHLKSKLNWVNWVTVLMVPSDLGTLSQDVGGKVGEISWRCGENDIVIHVVQGIVVTRSQVWSVIIAWWLQIIQKKRRNKWLYVQFMYQSQMSMESRVEELTKKLWKKTYLSCTTVRKHLLIRSGESREISIGWHKKQSRINTFSPVFVVFLAVLQQEPKWS